MIQGQTKHIHYRQNGSSICDFVQLKLIESDHSGFTRITNDLPSRHSFANKTTPASAELLRNYRFNHLEAAKKEGATSTHLDVMLGGRQKRYESATKILTLQQLKKEEQKFRQMTAIQHSSSRKIFITISKENDRKREKSPIFLIRKQDPEQKVATNTKKHDSKTSGISISVPKAPSRKGIHLLL